jgi:hypothetical protein
MMNKKPALKFLAIATLLAQSGGLAAQQAAPNYAIDGVGAAYSDIADLIVISPMIVDAKIKKTTKISAVQAVGVPQNLQRLLAEADVIALIRGQNDIAAKVRFVIDVPKDARGKIPKLNKQRVFIMADAVKGRPEQLQLIRPDSLVRFSPENDAMVRSITKEAVLLDAPQRITGIASAFHSAGTVIGEGETQIFLNTENRQPISISIVSRPGAPKQWSVSTSELIEETTSTPKRFTLLWYRLACGLPKALPAELVQSGEGENAARAQADFKFVADALGPCGRKRPTPKR